MRRRLHDFHEHEKAVGGYRWVLSYLTICGVFIFWVWVLTLDS